MREGIGFHIHRWTKWIEGEVEITYYSTKGSGFDTPHTGIRSIQQKECIFCGLKKRRPLRTNWG